MSKKHAKFSASSAERWINCPGSIKLSEKAPPQVESEYAKEGTKAHQCLEDLLRGAWREKLESRYPQEMIDYAVNAYNYIEDQRQFTDELLIETKAPLDDIVGPDCGGTADVSLVSLFDRLHVMDYKYGAGKIVEPEHNWQMISYAIGIAAKYDFNFERVKMTIIQPRAEHESGTVRSWEISMEELVSLIPIMKAAYYAALDNSPRYSAGDWCRWCPARALCPELSANKLLEAKADFSETILCTRTVAFPNGQRVNNIMLPTEFDIEKLGLILQSARHLRTWIDGVEELAEQHLNAGGKIEGFKLVPKRSIRKWIDPEKARLKAWNKWGNAALEIPTLKSPAQLEKLFGAKKFVEKYASNVSSGYTMVPESDKRNAVNPIAIDFAEPIDEASSVVKQSRKTKTSRKGKK